MFDFLIYACVAFTVSMIVFKAIESIKALTKEILLNHRQSSLKRAEAAISEKLVAERDHLRAEVQRLHKLCAKQDMQLYMQHHAQYPEDDRGA